MKATILTGKSLADRIGLLLVIFSLWSHPAAEAEGTWTSMNHAAQGGFAVTLLLSDGTVMCNQTGTTSWYRLTPDIHGAYATGTWSSLASMHYPHLTGGSLVLQDGRVMIVGGENSATGMTNAEIYNPVNNTWTLSADAGLAGGGAFGSVAFSDCGTVLLSNGKVLISPKGWGNWLPYNCLLYDPGANTWSQASFAGAPHGAYQDECSWVKLPDDSILTIDGYAPANPIDNIAERYIPSLNAWMQEATPPVSLFQIPTEEIGPGFLLPNGKAFFLGGTGHTVLFTPSPSGGLNTGSWTQGPDIPGGLLSADDPGVMMLNGKILCVVTPNGGATGGTPLSFYEYDYSAGTNGSFAQIHAPTGGFSDSGHQGNQGIFLPLPDGTVFYNNSDATSYFYHPDGSPVPAGKPTISAITWHADGSAHLAGTGLNGISQGAAFGDDVQMDSNYPLVRRHFGSNVYYGRTFNWSSTGVMTGTNPVAAEFALTPDGLNYFGADSIEVVANGIASDPVPAPVWVDFSSLQTSEFGTYSIPDKTLTLGVSTVQTNGTIVFKTSGSSTPNLTMSKPLILQAAGGSVVIGH